MVKHYFRPLPLAFFHGYQRKGAEKLIQPAIPQFVLIR